PCPAAKKESGSPVRRTEASDRAESLAPAATEVRARAVLPGRGSSEHQAAGALPQSASNTGSARHHLAERKRKNSTAQTRTGKDALRTRLFQHPRVVSPTRELVRSLRS